MTDGPRIIVTPVALRDAPQLDAVGVHEPHALRAIVGTATDKGISGLGETYAGQGPLRLLARAAGAVIRPGVLALPSGRHGYRVPPPRGSSGTATPSPGCTSRTRRADCATGTAPLPCNGSTPITASARRTGRRRPPRKEFSWHGSTG